MFFLSLLFASASLAYFAVFPGEHREQVTVHQSATDVSDATGETINVLSINIAHGRGEAFNQLFVNKDTFYDNLQAISNVLQQSSADIAALQEADAPSLWSGNVNQVDLIARQAGFNWQVHSNHASSWLYDFGTAVLSRLPVVSAQSHRFNPSPPTLQKGFVVSQVAWNNPAILPHPVLIDVVSLHLDFLSSETRTTQTEELIEILSKSQRPMIVLGDFNSEWQASDSSVKALASRMQLTAYQPQSESMLTHKNTRIDWILLSRELEFVSYSVLPDIVSDHLAVLATIRLKKPEI